MITLIDRLSKLDGPDREISCEVISSLISVDDHDAKDFYGSGKDYTASVEAAIALAERVLPGWTWYLGNGVNGSDANGSVAGIYPPKSPEDTFKGDHPIAAIALCIALLRAKEVST